MVHQRTVDVTFVLVLVVLLSGPAAVLGRARRGEDEDESRRLLERMMDAVERGMAFFSEDYSTLNVDGLFGMRLGQGQLIEALQECQSSNSCPENLQRRLKAVADDVDTTASAAMKYVKADDPDYYDRFIDTFNSPYRLRYNPTTLKDLSKTPAGSDDTYDEETGDSCFARVMGKFVEEEKPVKECNITNFCWDYMTEKGRAKYAITHQLLYFIMIEKQGCVEIAERTMGGQVAETEASLCGSIYSEAEAEVKEGKVRQMLQDLFLEQILVCGSIGYENFLRTDWMQMVLQWQKPVGCFSLDSPVLVEMEKHLSEYKSEERKLMKDLQKEVEMIEKQHPQVGRKLLREQVMDDGCLSHKSGLGFGTLCLFTRFLIRQNFLNQ